MKILFTAYAEMRNAADVVVFSASAGETRDLPEDQARRWIKRNKAVPHELWHVAPSPETAVAVTPTPAKTPSKPKRTASRESNDHDSAG